MDLLVGVPTHNNAKTVGETVQGIRVGLLKYFPRERAVILNVDGGSKDGTREVVAAASINDAQRSSDLYALRTLPCISTVYGDSPATEVALRTVLAAAELLRAKACAIVSPESTNITPDWMERLLRPVYRDSFDLVTPVYRRHKFDGLLLRNLVYPMTRALYAKRVRERASDHDAVEQSRQRVGELRAAVRAARAAVAHRVDGDPVVFDEVLLAHHGCFT